MAAAPLPCTDREKLSALFLGEVTKWPDGTRVLPVDAAQGSTLRESFSRSVHGRGAAAIKNYWLQQIFSGRGLPPPERPDDEGVLAYVRNNPGAVGYVSADRPTEGVSVLEIAP